MIPILTIDRADHAVPLARAVLAGGLHVIEVTLRTSVSLEAVRRIALEVPEAVVGAGSLRRPEDLDSVLAAGARFGASPGLDERLVRRAAALGLPYLPGVMTPSEAIRAQEIGVGDLKLFPAECAGGVALLESLSEELPELAFCPTGGLDEARFRSYLALDNVVCVGGSWLAPRPVVAARAWDQVTENARRVSALALDGAGPRGRG